MSFLHPLLLLASLAVGIPVWLHLRERTDPARSFSALRFLEDQRQPRRRGVRLRDLLLLAARATAVVLVAAAFAWPYRPQGRTGVTESRVYLLDNTLSQQAKGAFARDRDAVREAVRRAPPEVQVAVVELTSRPRVVAGFALEREAAARAIGALPPSFQRGSYLEAFRLADTLLSQSLGARRRIVVHGDGQENQWSESESSPPFLRGIETELARLPEEAEQANFSVGEPLSRRFFVGEKNLVEVTAQLRHPGRGKAAVVVEAGGRQVLRETFNLEGAPDLLTVRGQWEADASAWLCGQVRIEDARDALPADDQASFCVPPVREGKVAVLARSPYLRAALAPDTVRGRWAPQMLDPASDLAVVPERDLADVLVLEGDYAQSEGVRTLAFRYLNNGRGLILFAGRVTPLLAGFVRELGFEVAGTGAGADSFRYVAADHPIFKPFAKGELGELADAQVFRHLRLRGVQAVTLAFGASGDGLLFEGGATRGRLLVFPFAMERAETDWPLRTSFIPFLDLCLQHVRRAASVETSSEPGQPVVHEVPPERAAREVVLRSETGEVSRAAVDAQRRARLRGPESPGVYAITYDQGTGIESMLAVNPSSKESVLRYVQDPAALKAWTMPSSATSPSAAEPRSRLGSVEARAALAQRLWWWVLFAATAALTLESAQLLLRKERG